MDLTISANSKQVAVVVASYLRLSISRVGIISKTKVSIRLTVTQQAVTLADKLESDAQ